jgi:hypothetical protein
MMITVIVCLGPATNLVTRSSACHHLGSPCCAKCIRDGWGDLPALPLCPFSASRLILTKPDQDRPALEAASSMAA